MTKSAATLQRRNVLKLCGAAGVTTAANGLFSATARPARAADSLNLNQGFEDFVAYFRIISDLGGVSTFRYHAGKMLMVPAPRGLAEDFVDFVAIKQDRSRRLPNGDFQHAYKGVTMFTDKDTGAVLEQFENPVTGEINTVEPFATSGGSIVYTPEGPYALKPGADPTLTPEIGMRPTAFDWDVASEDVWITYPERFAIYDENGTAIAADNSMYRYMVKAADLMNPALSSVDCVMNWQTETGPWGWMNMPDTFTGHFIFGSLGRKYGALTDLPAPYVETSEARFPGHLSELIDWDDFVLPHSRR